MHCQPNKFNFKSYFKSNFKSKFKSSLISRLTSNKPIDSFQRFSFLGSML